MTNFMQPTQLTDSISNIASKDAQYILNWVFIALIIACGVFAFLTGKWFIGYLTQQRELLAGLFKEAAAGREHVASVVAENTVVVRECRDTIYENTEFLKRMER